MTTFRKFIEEAVANGLLKNRFTSQEVKRAMAEAQLEPKYITSRLNNSSEGPGNRKGAGAAAWLTKHADKSFSLKQNVGESPEGITTRTGGNSTNAKKIEATPENTAVQRFVDYLENMPFRILMKSSGGREPTWHPQNDAACGWVERLSAYEWEGKKWDETKPIIDKFTKSLDSLEKQWKEHPGSLELEKTAKDIYDKIRKWGNERGAPRKGKDVLGYLVKLWDKNEIGAVDSTLTKLYAFARPNEYVIYDSRVAMAIVRIAEFMYPVKTQNKRQHDTVEDFMKCFKHLGTVDGVGGTRLGAVFRQKWPRARTIVKAQYEANRFCVAIVKHLNEKKVGKREDWKLREVEAVLFMEGY